MNHQLLVPASILGAGALIGAGLFLGLSARPAPEPRATPAAVAPPALAPAPPPLLTGLAKEVAAALARQKPEMVTRCWEPSLKTSPTPGTGRYTFDVTIDPSGHEIARSISDDGATARADVRDCLRRLPIGLDVSPPRAQVRVSVPFDLP
jgi:hypothetical protein